MKNPALEPLARPADVTRPPSWVHAVVPGAVGAAWEKAGDRVRIRGTVGEEAALVSVRIENAGRLATEDFRAATAEAYRTIGRTLAPLGCAHPRRVWNVIPRILEPCGTLPHRYMVFNAGRIEGYRSWLGPAAVRRGVVPTATGVGHRGEAMVIHCLAGTSPSRFVENPRQVPACRYSTRYGPLPPCFARATVLPATTGGRTLALVGGTASVVGEDSRHPRDLEAQTRETLANLAAVVDALRLDPRVDRRGDALSTYGSLRVHFVDEAHRPRLERLIEPAFEPTTEIEWVRADLCRPELLVEIEGVAELDGAAHAPIHPRPERGAKVVTRR